MICRREKLPLPSWTDPIGSVSQKIFDTIKGNWASNSLHSFIPMLKFKCGSCEKGPVALCYKDERIGDLTWRSLEDDDLMEVQLQMRTASCHDMATKVTDDPTQTDEAGR